MKRHTYGVIDPMALGFVLSLAGTALALMFGTGDERPPADTQPGVADQTEIQPLHQQDDPQLTSSAQRR